MFDRTYSIRLDGLSYAYHMLEYCWIALHTPCTHNSRRCLIFRTTFYARPLCHRWAAILMSTNCNLINNYWDLWTVSVYPIALSYIRSQALPLCPALNSWRWLLFRWVFWFSWISLLLRSILSPAHPADNHESESNAYASPSVWWIFANKLDNGISVTLTMFCLWGDPFPGKSNYLQTV